MKMDKVAGSGNDEFYTPEYAIKPIKAKGYAIFANNEIIDVWCSKKEAQHFVELEIKLGSFIEYRIIPVLITPLSITSKAK